MSLKPLLDRLKRTDAPTVEEVRIWKNWACVRDSREATEHHLVDYGGVLFFRCGDGRSFEAAFYADEKWYPLATFAELLALAALPGKVAEAVRQADLAVAHDCDYGYIAGKIREVDVLAIVGECTK